jgi:hypothetical protein
MDITNLLELSYWFQQPFIARGTTTWIWVGIFLFGIFVGLILKFIGQKLEEKYQKKMLNSFSNLGLGAGLLGLLWLFFRQEQVPFFAWRFWLIFLVAWALVVIVKNILFMVRRLPQIRAEHTEKAIKEKYLPK